MNKPQNVLSGWHRQMVTSIKLVIALFVIHMLCLSMSVCLGQSNFIFDQETKGVSCPSCNWKVGKTLKVMIKNYGGTGLRYEIVYTSSERVNSEGLKLFNSLSSESVLKEVPSYVSSTITYLEVPIENKDYSHLTITEYEGTKKIEERVFSYRAKGGMKFDVSTGFFVSGLVNDEYILVNSGDTARRIIGENVADFKVGVGVLAHLHSRWNSIINLGVAGGFEISNEAKVGYLAGGSIFLGYDQKFVFSGGAAFGKRQEISNGYAEGQVVDNSLSVVPMVNVWDWNWFGALTYNF